MIYSTKAKVTNKYLKRVVHPYHEMNLWDI